eukprot:CAMPEP_0196582152 /NCGR_PEP_ID=MMETSP1081-20130531/37684_1 /TAXON_ID=36882 /ORGANISM="Pyramimonas amylifera, Strain CCMP720" /LENGTH=166 /DNA_ID=CAMNT_0041902637 /DNA_START=398 /DNA_END=898 /DNA_ORIENTATION=-
MNQNGSVTKKGILTPQPNWASLPSFWSFQYKHPRGLNTFQLNASNNRGKMFVQVREMGNPHNTRVLGLSVDKYVSCTFEEARKSKVQWEGLLCDTDRLVGMIQEHILSPLTSTMIQKPEEELTTYSKMQGVLLGSEDSYWNWKTQLVVGIVIMSTVTIVFKLRSSK